MKPSPCTCGTVAPWSSTTRWSAEIGGRMKEKNYSGSS
jgi:hypothetical protein